MARGWPPLKKRQVIEILTALGFVYSHTKGGHEFYKATVDGLKCSVTVSTHIADFSEDLLQFMCKQACSNRKAFYGATPGTRAKI